MFHRGLRPASAGDHLLAHGGLPPQQTSSPGGLYRPLGFVHLHRHGQQAERRAAQGTTTPVAELAEAITRAPALHVDETGWRQTRKRFWLWAAVGEGMTLFRIDRHRSTAALRRLVGAKITPVLTTDRYAAYQTARCRQICWAHLRRDFQAMIDRKAAAERRSDQNLLEVLRVSLYAMVA